MSQEVKSHIYVDDVPVAAQRVVIAGKDDASAAAAISSMYNQALGENGVLARGHQAYPDPDLFSESGVRETLIAGERTLAIAVEGAANDCQSPLGAMVMDRLSPYHVEFNSMAVPPAHRGRSIGTRIVEALRDLIDESDFTVNATELVTHSLASQAAHFSAGYRNICGFGYAQYPRVFFAEHNESVLWVVRLQGKLARRLRQMRSSIGRDLRDPEIALTKIVESQTRFAGAASYVRLDEKNLQIAADVLTRRTVYVPSEISGLVETILFQFEDVLDREVATSAEKSDGKGGFTVDYKEGYGHAYIVFDADYALNLDKLKDAVSDLQDKGKHFILVRMSAFCPNTPETAATLSSLGFVFHSYLPLYGYFAEASAKFQDVLTMQWISPQVMEKNALPGETESVIKVFGYPENLSGAVIKTIRRQLGGSKR